jgi:hypothetical protein
MDTPRLLVCLLLALGGFLPAEAGALPLLNAGFDSDLSGWSGTGSWAPLDVQGDPDSGSALLRAHELESLSQCVPATPGVVEAGASVFVPSGQSGIVNFGVSVIFFAAPGCAGLPFNLPLAVIIAPLDVWSFVPGLSFPEVPGGAQSALFRLGFLSFQGEVEAYFDAPRVAFVPEPELAWLVLATVPALARARLPRSRLLP